MKKSILLSSLITALFLFPSCDSSETEVTTDLEESNNELVEENALTNEYQIVSDGDSQKYISESYGFEFNFPLDAFVKESSTKDDYIRIQNYTATNDGPGGLNEGEFYLEIHISPDGGDCESRLEEATELDMGENVIAFRGLGLPGGDAGGQRYALCIDTDDLDFYVQATEQEPGGIANAILDSFTLTSSN